MLTKKPCSTELQELCFTATHPVLPEESVCMFTCKWIFQIWHCFQFFGPFFFFFLFFCIFHLTYEGYGEVTYIKLVRFLGTLCRCVNCAFEKCGLYSIFVIHSTIATCISSDTGAHIPGTHGSLHQRYITELFQDRFPLPVPAEHLHPNSLCGLWQWLTSHALLQNVLEKNYYAEVGKEEQPDWSKEAKFVRADIYITVISHFH